MTHMLRGFTLIEMLVVIGIIGIMSVGAVASYNSYNNWAKVEQGARLVATQLRSIQKDVTTGTSNCGTSVFNGVEISRAVSGKQVVVKNVCGGVVGAQRLAFPTPAFGDDLTIAPFTPFQIETVGGGTTMLSEIVVQSTVINSMQFAVTMTMAGGVGVAKKN